MIDYRFAVVGDIHANSVALRSALDLANASGYDELIFLGDLLTYGVDVAEVIDLISSVSINRSSTILRGNHDDLYLHSESDLNVEYLNKFPEWIRESFYYTKNKLHNLPFNSLPFLNNYTYSGVYFSHANPFGDNDWRYINSEQDHLFASDILANMSKFCGVFGHTHRAKLFSLSNGLYDVDAENFYSDFKTNLDLLILNPGSIGQPRGCERNYVLIVDVSKNNISVHFKSFEYNLKDHIDGLFKSGMSIGTISKLASFFHKY